MTRSLVSFHVSMGIGLGTLTLHREGKGHGFILNAFVISKKGVAHNKKIITPNAYQRMLLLKLVCQRRLWFAIRTTNLCTFSVNVPNGWKLLKVLSVHRQNHRDWISRAIYMIFINEFCMNFRWNLFMRISRETVTWISREMSYKSNSREHFHVKCRWNEFHMKFRWKMHLYFTWNLWVKIVFKSIKK